MQKHCTCDVALEELSEKFVRSQLMKNNPQKLSSNAATIARNEQCAKSTFIMRNTKKNLIKSTFPTATDSKHG